MLHFAGETQVFDFLWLFCLLENQALNFFQCFPCKIKGLDNSLFWAIRKLGDKTHSLGVVKVSTMYCPRKQGKIKQKFPLYQTCSVAHSQLTCTWQILSITSLAMLRCTNTVKTVVVSIMPKIYEVSVGSQKERSIFGFFWPEYLGSPLIGLVWPKLSFPFLTYLFFALLLLCRDLEKE